MIEVEAKGCRIPAIGFGTYPLTGADAVRAVAAALEVGYRHIDTAQMYENEAAVGEAVASSGVARADLFLVTKVRPERSAAGEIVGSVEESLARLRTDRVDLLLLHWPVFPDGLPATIEALVETQERGLARHVGVSNFNRPQLRAAQRVAEDRLVTNQVEYHPFLDQSAMLAELRRAGMALSAYAPLARGRIAAEPALATIAARHGRTPAQVSLRWLVQQGDVVAVPKAASAPRMRENIDVLGFALDADEMAAITALGSPAGRLIEPATFTQDWDAA